MKIKIVLLALIAFAPIFVHAQNVRVDIPVPSISSTTSVPFLVANVPPNSPVLSVCNFPANDVPCTNYATTYDSAGNACSNGAQDTPQPQPSACQATGDAEGNIGFWIPAGKYDYTVCIANNCSGPNTITPGGSGSSGGATVEINNNVQPTTNFNGTTPLPDSGFNAGTFKTDTVNTILEVPKWDPSEFCLIGSGLGSQFNIGFQSSTSPCSTPAIEIIQGANGGMGLFGPVTVFNTLFAGAVDVTTGPLYNDVVNCASNPAVTNKLARFFGGCTVQTLVGDTSGILGVTGNSGGASLGAQIAVAGHIPCIFDGATSAGDWVINSVSVAGDCSDSGVSAGLPQPSGTQTVGIVTSTNGGAGTYQIYITNGSSGGGSGAGTVTHTGALAVGVGVVGNSGADIKPDTNFDDGVTTANTFTIKSTSGLAVNSGGVVNLIGIKDSSTNCPTTVAVGTVAICSASFAPEIVGNNSGTPFVNPFDMASSNGVANGIATLDGSANVPAIQLFNWANTWFSLTSCTSLALTTSGSIFTNCDLGASPDTTLFGITDTSVTAGDNSTNFFCDTGTSSVHVACAMRIRGINQLQVVEQPGPEGQVVVGSAVVPNSLGNSPFTKMFVMSNTATHNVLSVYQNNTSQTGTLFPMVSATAATTAGKAMSLCSGATGSNGQCGSGLLGFQMFLDASTLYKTTSAAAQFAAWKNFTAAVVGASQSSPNLALCGTEWHSAASTEGCANLQFVPGTGLDAANTISLTHTGPATGITTFQAPGPIASGGDGVHAAEAVLFGNTTAPPISANSANFIGPNSASFTGYGIQLPAALPTVGPKIAVVGAVSSQISQETFIDYPDVHIYPAANCVATVAGAGWSTALTPACIAGSNNLGGQLPFADASTAQFETEIPLDWDTASQPFVNVFFNSGANTSGTVIFNVAVACTKSDGSITSDPAFNTADALATKTMAAASRTWSTSVQLTQVTSGNNCIPGGTMLVKVTRASDSASAVVQVTKLVMTTPRLLAVQAN